MNEYESLIDSDDEARSQRRSASVYGAFDSNPDGEAALIRISQRSGIPVEGIRGDNGLEAKRKIAVDSLEMLPSHAPAFAKFLEDPTNAALVVDEHENMSGMEKAFSVLKNTGRALASVPWSASAGVSGVLQSMGELDDLTTRPLKDLWQKVTGIEQQEGALTRYAKSTRTGATETAKAIKGDTSGAGTLERGFYSGVESLGQNLLTLPLTIMSGSPAPMLTSMTATTGGQAYGEARDKNVDVLPSLTYGMNQAAIEYLTEVAPALVLVKNLKAKSGIMKFGRDMLASEIPNEQYATVLQDLNEWAVLNPEKPFSEYVKARPGAAIETLIATIVGTGGMVVTSKGLEKVADTVGKHQDAQQNRDFLLALGDSVQASKLRKRMPEKLQELVKSMKEEHGTPEHAYIDAQKLTELWQSAGYDPQKKAAELLSTPSDYLEALATGSEIAIPLEEFAARFTGEEYYKTLLDDVRLGTGASTIREAQEFDKTGRDKALNELLAEAEDIAPTASDVRVYDDVLGQLIGTGMERGTAERNALVMKSVFRTLGARTGIDAHELYKQYGLTITRPLPEVLSKRISVDLSIDPLLDRLRSGDIPKDSAVRGKSLTEMLRQKGIKDSGGELKNLDPDRGKGKKLIRNKDGFEMDQALVAAKEQGYLPETATIADFLDAISNDLQGRGVYSDQALDERLLEDQLSLTQMKEYLESQDIDIAGMTNDEIRKVLQEATALSAGDSVLARYDQSPESERGLAITEYKKGDETDRTRAVNEFATELDKKKANILFQGIDNSQNSSKLSPVTYTEENYHERLSEESRKSLSGNLEAGAGVAATVHRTNEVTAQGWKTREAGRVKAEESQLLEQWAIDNGLMLDSAPRVAEWKKQGSLAGTESKVYFREVNGNKYEAVKLIASGASATWQDFFLRIAEFNTLFPSTKYTFEGFTKIGDELNAVLSQDFVVRDENAEPVTDAEIQALFESGGFIRRAHPKMVQLGLKDPASDQYYNPKTGAVVEDFNHGNVFRNSEGIVFIDVVIFHEPKEVMELYQNKADVNRGFIRWGADRKFNIGFLENADLSTFLHEGGHFYFEVLADLAKRDDVPQQVRDDFQTLLKHVGASSYADVTTEQHEVIARSFEAYLMEGKAPSLELQGAFQRMKAWFVQIYKEIRKLNVKLNDDVRGVFDRLVASDEEIEAARERSNMKEVFASAADMGVSEAEFQVYRKQGEKAHAAQVEKLEREYMAELTRQNKLWWNEGLDKMAAQVDAETQEDAVYIAIQVLTKGVNFQGVETPLKLDRKSLEKQYGKSVVKRLPRGMYAKEGGMTADQVAEMMGFDSGADMVEAMITVPQRKEYVKAEAERRMRALHGDLLTDGSAADEAAQAVHSDEQGKVFAEELRAMRKLQVTAEKITRAKEGADRAVRNESLGAVPPAEFFKDLAREMVAKKTIEELNPYRYQQAESKAGRESFEAAAKKDWAKAADAKQRQLLNHHLYKEAAGVKRMVEKQVGKWQDLIKKSDKRLAATRDMNIVTAARAILAQYGIGDSTDKALAALQLVQQYDANLYESLQMAVDVATQEPKPYKSMDVIEFIGLMDAVNNLWHLSRRSKVAMIDGREVALEEISGDLIAQIGDRSRPLAGIGKVSAVTDRQKFAIGFLGMGAALKRVEHWSVEMDRGDSGPFRKYIVQPIYQAVTQYKTEKKPVIEKLREIFSRLPAETFADQKIAATEIGYTFKNKGELLHAILHTGNESNLKKLLVGRGWALADENGLDKTGWDQFIGRMHTEGVLTQDDYIFAQEIWDLLESTKPAAQKAHHDMYGFYFSEITAEEVVTPFGVFRGGYVPAITDPYIVETAAERADQENLLQDNSSSMFPATTGKGFTMSRVAGYNKPLLLDLGLLAVHVDKVLRFSYMGPAVQDVGRILNDSELKEIFKEINPGWSSEMLIPWLKRTARQAVETKSSGWGGKAADAIFRGLRRRTGLQLMAANIANATQQLTGVFPAMVKVKPRLMGSALLQFSKAPLELTAEIADKSPWMRDRLDNEIGQISGELREILVQSKYEKVQEFGMRAGYWASGAAQHIVDVIAWQGAYEQAILDGQDERGAVSLADSIVRQTQGSFAPEDASSFEAGSPFVRLFTQFYSYFNMIANLSITESKNAVADSGWKGGSSRLFYIYMMAFALPSFLSQLIMAAMRGKVDEDDDGEYIDDLLAMFFTGQGRAATALIPGAGQIINSAVGRFTKAPQDDRMSVSPAVGSIEGSVGVAKDLYDVLLDGKELKRAHVRDVFTLLGMATGLPMAAAARPLGYAVAAESGKTEPANSVDYVRGLMTGYAPRPGAQ